MTTHTAGPWKLETESRSPDGSDLVITTADGAYTIADCRLSDTGVRYVEEAEANARLIAAAPELLGAVRRAYAEIRDIEHMSTVAERLRRAINSAEASA